MKRITNFLNECKKCELLQPKYNGFNDEENYEIYIKKLYDDAVSALIENTNENTIQLIKERCNDIDESIQYSDFPSNETLNQIKEERKTNTNKALQASYSYLIMAKNCRDRQLYLFKEFKKYLKSDNTTENNDIIDNTFNTQYTSQEEYLNNEDNEYIKGIRKLAEFLQCGNNRANEIVKSRILEDEGVQFKMGNSYRFHKKKLMDLLSRKPDVFKDVHWH